MNNAVASSSDNNDNDNNNNKAPPPNITGEEEEEEDDDDDNFVDVESCLAPSILSDQHVSSSPPPQQHQQDDPNNVLSSTAATCHPSKDYNDNDNHHHQTPPVSDAEVLARQEEEGGGVVRPPSPATDTKFLTLAPAMEPGALDAAHAASIHVPASAGAPRTSLAADEEEEEETEDNSRRRQRQQQQPGAVHIAGRSQHHQANQYQIHQQQHAEITTLIHAEVVRDAPFVTAVPAPPQDDPNYSMAGRSSSSWWTKPRNLVAAFSVVAIVVVIIIIVIIVVVTTVLVKQKNNDDAENNTPTLPPLVVSTNTTTPPPPTTTSSTTPAPTPYPTLPGVWKLVGLAMDGEAAGDLSGRFVDLSADGRTVAIGAHRNDGGTKNGTMVIDAGHVRVYRLETVNDDVHEEEWVQVGSDLDGLAAKDAFGWSVSLAANGTIVAIGAADERQENATGYVRVYQYLEEQQGGGGGEWVQVGSELSAEAFGDNFGIAVSLSADGATLAVGAHQNDSNGTDSGHVRVYQTRMNGDDGASPDWMQVGREITGEMAGDHSGWSVSLAADGMTVAIGARHNSDNGRDKAGHVRVYRRNETTDEWIQVGRDLDGEKADDRFGRSVSLSANGGVVAVGASLNDGNGKSSGHVRVFELNGRDEEEEWVQVGRDLDGEARRNQFGFSVSLSADGRTLAVGGRTNDGNGRDAGHARVYRQSQEEGKKWMQVGIDLDGEAPGDEFGESVSLSADGMTVAVGGWKNDGNGKDSGHVRVFRLVEE